MKVLDVSEREETTLPVLVQISKKSILPENGSEVSCLLEMQFGHLL
jgi:hypothetical protein